MFLLGEYCIFSSKYFCSKFWPNNLLNQYKNHYFSLGNRSLSLPCSFYLFSTFHRKKKTQESYWWTTTVELKFITSTSCPIWEIKHWGMLSRWNHHVPPTLFSCTAGGGLCKRQKEKEERFYDGLLGCNGAWFIGWPPNLAASERALVIWTARQLGLSSETQRGEVGDHVWGPPSCYCP